MFDLFRPKVSTRPTKRSARLTLEQLETRNLPSATTPSAHALAAPTQPRSQPALTTSNTNTPPPSNVTEQPNFTLEPLDTGGKAPYTPAQIAQAYGFNQISFTNPKGGSAIVGSGAGETIAIVDAYSDPNIQSDLATFDSTFSLPKANLIVASPSGAKPPANSSWGVEISLDVEWAHAMAPGATILLVEANSSSLGDLLNAVSYAANYQGNSAQGIAPTSVVSMSWGGGEWSGESGYDSYFTTPKNHANVSFVASSGDNGYGASWPSISPNVLSVGGTSLFLNTSNNWSSETGWSGSGGGYSQFESRPVYQNGVSTNSKRSNPDVAYIADPNTGLYVYDTYYPGGGGWWEVGGTSAGAPQWSALTAIADQGRALAGKTPLANVQSDVYSLPSTDFHDVTKGSNGGASAKTGYDLVTGLGSPLANQVVSGLVGSTDTLTSGTGGSTGSTGSTGGSTGGGHKHR